MSRTDYSKEVIMKYMCLRGEPSNAHDDKWKGYMLCSGLLTDPSIFFVSEYLLSHSRDK